MMIDLDGVLLVATYGLLRLGVPFLLMLLLCKVLPRLVVPDPA